MGSPYRFSVVGWHLPCACIIFVRPDANNHFVAPTANAGYPRRWLRSGGARIDRIRSMDGPSVLPDPAPTPAAGPRAAGLPYPWLVVGMLWWISFFNYADRQAIFSVF